MPNRCKRLTTTRKTSASFPPTASSSTREATAAAASKTDRTRMTIPRQVSMKPGQSRIFLASLRSFCLSSSCLWRSLFVVEIENEA